MWANLMMLTQSLYTLPMSNGVLNEIYGLLGDIESNYLEGRCDIGRMPTVRYCRDVLNLRNTDLPMPAEEAVLLTKAFLLDPESALDPLRNAAIDCRKYLQPYEGGKYGPREYLTRSVIVMLHFTFDEDLQADWHDALAFFLGLINQSSPVGQQEKELLLRHFSDCLSVDWRDSASV
jgi:hypothetical protein